MINQETRLISAVSPLCMIDDYWASVNIHKALRRWFCRIQSRKSHRSPLCRACNSLALVGSMRVVDFPCAHFARISRNNFLVSFSCRFCVSFSSRRWYAGDSPPPSAFPSPILRCRAFPRQNGFCSVREISFSVHFLFLISSLVVTAAYPGVKNKLLAENNREK